MLGWIANGKQVIGVSTSTGVELQSTATAVIVANTLGFLSNYKNYKHCRYISPLSSTIDELGPVIPCHRCTIIDQRGNLCHRFIASKEQGKNLSTDWYRFGLQYYSTKFSKLPNFFKKEERKTP